MMIEQTKGEQELRRQIAETLPCFRDIFDRMPCPYNGECGKCGDIREAVDHLVVILKEGGYVKLPPDSAILEGISNLKNIKGED